jgi:hypothetical protein
VAKRRPTLWRAGPALWVEDKTVNVMHPQRRAEIHGVGDHI